MAFDWTAPSASPLVIAHRGGALLATENTAAAFSAARGAGAHAIETDVRRTADGALVCVHDADLMRLAGDPRSVSALTFQELRASLPEVMMLDEALTASETMGVLLDVKTTDSAILAPIMAVLAEGEAIERTMLGLRELSLIEAARMRSEAVNILAFLEDCDAAREACDAGANWFRLWEGDATGQRAEAVRAAGLHLAVMVGQPRAQPLPDEYPPFPVGHIDAAGLAALAAIRPDAILLDDPRLVPNLQVSGLQVPQREVPNSRARRGGSDRFKSSPLSPPALHDPT
ncbi:glycerophosphodiester phosphodiesterase [Chelatococcus asaccharovorans]|uniref:Glycerophosphoryl diester phosphodiesterase n=1 Tax=Chelatococcus asaccharovorans TaxID=28210 RepID=A0A2V3UDZ7_9HYPH|nr:glycerophosphodiester phosphodiesterase family protein [Chelatococcus asaccharovorans]MBS7706977.1 cobalamin biosynthesis protein [Chelatococcus asaccharovorans]PXW63157.1 glycerophosphoryl diester phosphodiesterase [Chelatococcus asaccharovorans]CAH1653608.1 Glycerophosphoryl diester phosphodiesterase [Chelatococcus asaccharovorans]CAH1694219.1 Glycerophosphoryl diester phosphodiesterase [Chelatococcus asaccharovorans]